MSDRDEQSASGSGRPRASGIDRSTGRGPGVPLQEARLRSQEWLGQTLRSIGDAVIATDTAGRIVFMNPVAERLTGWLEAEALGCLCDEVFHILDHDSGRKVESPIVRVIRDGAVVGLANHTVLVPKSGGKFPIDDSAAPIRDEEGRLLGIVLVFRDVSERAAAEASLRASEERYRAIVETANEGVWMVDSAYRTTFVNPRMAEMLGYRVEEMIGRPVTDFMEPEVAAFTREKIGLRRKGVREHYDARYRRKDGTDLWVLINTTPMLDEGGQFCGALAMMTDITERTQAAAEQQNAQKDTEVRAAQQRAIAGLGLRAIATSSLDSWMQDVAETVAGTLDVEFCKILELLPSGDMLLKAGVGWAPGLVGNTIVPGGKESQAGYSLLNDGPVIVEDLPAETRFNGPALLTQHGVRSGMSVIVYQAGGRRWGVLGAHTRRHRRFTADDVAFFQGIANLMALVIERNRYEAEITGLNRRLQRAIAETHHRVKNNLQVISALVDVQAMRGDAAVPTAELERLGQHVRALATIHDLLTEEARANPASVEYLSTKEVMDRLMPLLQAMLGKRPIQFTIDDVRLPIRQGTGLAILVNELVSNATKHGRGEVRVELSIAGRSARLDVCDAGPGFPSGFDANKVAHTGLELVENVGRWDLQGKIDYVNRPGGGARVTVTFPVTPRAAAEPRGAAPYPNGN